MLFKWAIFSVNVVVECHVEYFKISPTTTSVEVSINEDSKHDNKPQFDCHIKICKIAFTLQVFYIIYLFMC